VADCGPSSRIYQRRESSPVHFRRKCEWVSGIAEHTWKIPANDSDSYLCVLAKHVWRSLRIFDIRHRARIEGRPHDPLFGMMNRKNTFARPESIRGEAPRMKAAGLRARKKTDVIEIGHPTDHKIQADHAACCFVGRFAFCKFDRDSSAKATTAGKVPTACISQARNTGSTR